LSTLRESLETNAASMRLFALVRLTKCSPFFSWVNIEHWRMGKVGFQLFSYEKASPHDLYISSNKWHSLALFVNGNTTIFLALFHPVLANQL